MSLSWQPWTGLWFWIWLMFVEVPMFGLVFWMLTSGWLTEKENADE